METWEKLAVVAMALLLIFCLSVIALKPKFEAETYARLTGKKVTYWDAVWLDLRIQEQVSQQPKEKHE